jgi:hypothetical protein
MATINESDLICLKCNCNLEYATTNLYYLTYKVSEKFLQCPQCKQVFIPEEIVLGKMVEVEETLEDK